MIIAETILFFYIVMQNAKVYIRCWILTHFHHHLC